MKKLKEFFMFLLIASIFISCTQPVENNKPKKPGNGGVIEEPIDEPDPVKLGTVRLSFNVELPAFITKVKVKYSDNEKNGKFIKEESLILTGVKQGETAFSVFYLDKNDVQYYKSTFTIDVKADVKYTIDKADILKVNPISFSIPTGIVAPNTKLTILSSDDTVDIYYTTDDTDPDNESILYEDGIILTETVKIKAIGIKDGIESSEIISASYEVSDKITPSPIITPGVKDHTASFEISISSEEGAVIYYTLNGNEPTESSEKYSKAIEITKEGIYAVKAVAKSEGKELSNVVSFVYELKLESEVKKVSIPVFSADSDTYTEETFFSLNTSTDNAKIYYTTNGNIPEKKENNLYSSSFSLNEGTYTIKAVAVKDNFEDSELLTVEVKVSKKIVTGLKVSMPVFSASDAEPYKSATKFELKSVNPDDAKIYYTTNNSTPSVDQMFLYSGSFSLSEGSYIIRAIAVKDGFENSDMLVMSVDVKDENTDPADFTVYYKKPTGWEGAFIHYWHTATAPLTNWFTGGVAMKDEGNGWYSHTFDPAILEGGKISFLFKDKQGGTSTQTADFEKRSAADPNWYYSDKVWYAVNPEKPSAPVVTVAPNSGTLNGDDRIIVKIVSVNDVLSEKVVTFAGKTVNMTGESVELVVKDYITADKTSAQLEIKAVNSTGTTNRISTFTRDDEKEIKGIKLYFEGSSPVLYVWMKDSSGKEVYPMGGWPGKALTDTYSGTAGKTWYVFDGGDADAVNFILNAQGGGNQSRTKTGWLSSEGKWYDEDPYKPSAPIINVNFSNNATYKGDKSMSVEITARNASISSESAKVNGVSFDYKKSNLVLSDIIKTDMTTATIVIEASNEVGTVKREYKIKRDDNYTIPTGMFTWDNALVYFVLTDRFYDGDPSNNFSYGRKRFDDEVLDLATFHGGDVKGLTKKIEEGYFSELGINAIWLTATYEQIHGWVGGGSGDFPHYAYHGYYALDWTMMDRNMGTVDEMREFVTTAHKHNIRVVMDIVLNHTGYATFMDMYDYGFGSFDKSVVTDRNWLHPLERKNWQSHHHEILFYNEEDVVPATGTPLSDWMKWWGPDWVRAGLSGHNAGNGSFIEAPLAGLPDIRTEIKTPVPMAPIMKTKWAKETTSEYDPWIVPANKKLRNPNSSVVPAEFIINALAGWVEEFGIDGFRVDTAKHVELFRWKELKIACDAALKRWRASSNSNGDPAKNWKEDFWMTGEVWDQGVNKNDYYSNGFDSLINFTFPHKNGDGSVGATWDGYAQAINTDPDFNVLTYINSHDMGKVGFFGKGSHNIKAGTALVLTPGGVQIFYGDENDRAKGPNCTDPDHPIRSSYQWGANPDKLAHWNKLGQFRNLHFAVGAGLQTTIGSDVYYREATINGVTDKVVIAINAAGNTTIDVTGKWADGTVLRDFYAGNTDTVTGGKVTFQAHANGVILIEEVK